jgi:hypothetical protein
MANITRKPRIPSKSAVDIVSPGDGARAARFTMQPGWRWSESVAPLVGTPSCQVRHVGAVVTGHLHIRRGGRTELAPPE